MSNARNLANLLGTGTTVPSAKVATLTASNMPVGSVIQTVSLTKSTSLEVQTHNTWTSLYSDANCLKITPSATANKVFIQYLLDRGNGNTSGETYTEYRKHTAHKINTHTQTHRQHARHINKTCTINIQYARKQRSWYRK